MAFVAVAVTLQMPTQDVSTRRTQQSASAPLSRDGLSEHTLARISCGISDIQRASHPCLAASSATRYKGSHGPRGLSKTHATHASVHGA